MTAQERDGRLLAEWIALGLGTREENEEEVRNYAKDYGIDSGRVWEYLADYAEKQGYTEEVEA